jgi:hypothetical protein
MANKETHCNRLAISSAYKSMDKSKVVPAPMKQNAMMKYGGVEVQPIIEATLTLPIVEITPTNSPFTQYLYFT